MAAEDARCSRVWCLKDHTSVDDHLFVCSIAKQV